MQFLRKLLTRWGRLLQKEAPLWLTLRASSIPAAAEETAKRAPTLGSLEAETNETRRTLEERNSAEEDESRRHYGGYSPKKKALATSPEGGDADLSDAFLNHA